MTPKNIEFKKKVGKTIETASAPFSQFDTEEKRSAFMKKYGFTSYTLS